MPKSAVSENILIFLKSVGLYTVVLMLFGAPFFEQLVATVSLAILLTCFTTLPLLTLDHVSCDRINAVYFNPRLSHEWFLASVGHGTLIGTWLSAGLLILDWDRPWQQWPYPCIMGSLGGAVIGYLFHLVRPRFIQLGRV